MSEEFVISNPEVDFNIIDGGTGTFDGRGDEVFSSFNTVVNGTEGEAGAFVEFELDTLEIPDNATIENATVEVEITSFSVTGLGVSDLAANPDSLNVYGYVGNGVAEPSDFEAGTLIGSIDISSSAVGDVVSLDVTPLVQTLIDDGESFAGFGFRASEFGGLAIRENSNFPQLTISISDGETEGQFVQGSNGKDNLEGGAGNDTISGKNGGDVLFGLDGNDLLLGDRGKDKLNGGMGDDTLIGGSADDTLVGGSGNDILIGGNRRDVFVLAPTEGTDTINDFELEADLIGLSNGLTFEALTFMDNKIIFEDETLAIINEFDTSSLTEDNFISV